MLEESNRELSDLLVEEPGWLQMLGHRATVFGILAASLSLDAAFMLIWLCIHALFILSSAIIEGQLRGRLNFPEGQTLAIQPFKMVFFFSTTLLDLAAFAVMVYFIWWDVRNCWGKISSSSAPKRR